jgi:hypothetical protein
MIIQESFISREKEGYLARGVKGATLMIAAKQHTHSANYMLIAVSCLL